MSDSPAEGGGFESSERHFKNVNAGVGGPGCRLDLSRKINMWAELRKSQFRKLTRRTKSGNFVGRLGKIPETGKEKNAKKRQEVEEERMAMGANFQVNSDNQTDRLEAYRFKTKSEIPIYQVQNARKFRETICMGRGGNPKGRNPQ